MKTGGIPSGFFIRLDKIYQYSAFFFQSSFWDSVWNHFWYLVTRHGFDGQGYTGI